MNDNLEKILVTGSAGFIGFHLTKELLDNGFFVIGVDNFNDYYDVKIKEDRNRILETYNNFKLIRGDLSNQKFVENIFKNYKFNSVYHLAAQTGVQYSKENPQLYIKNNINVFINILESIRKYNILNLVLASSSTVYGKNTKIPFSPEDKTDNPISLYAATKKSDEILAYTYHHLYDINISVLRLFSVIGPYGRPDMIPTLFTKSILNGETINIFNNGRIKRAFTDVKDVVLAFISSMDNCQGYNIYNVGNSDTHDIEQFISVYEKILNKKVSRKYTDSLSGDMSITEADIRKTKKDLNWEAKISFEDSALNFISWYKDYYNIK